jgi:chromosome segregation ATPase
MIFWFFKICFHKFALYRYAAGAAAEAGVAAAAARGDVEGEVAELRELLHSQREEAELSSAAAAVAYAEAAAACERAAAAEGRAAAAEARVDHLETAVVDSESAAADALGKLADLEEDSRRVAALLHERDAALATATAEVTRLTVGGLYKLNAGDPYSLKAPGFPTLGA